MSSISSVNSSSSIYGNRNIISGLASGMDTEAMIENAVSGYQTKITNLQQDKTVYEWKQEAYQSIIDKLVKFNQSYADYTSSTNLLSQSFFNGAMKVSATGANANKVSATGETNSAIQINSITQLAKAATYTVSGSKLGTGSDIGNVIKGVEVSGLNTQKDVSAITGSLTLTDGTNSATINLGEGDVYDSLDELIAGINDKLGENSAFKAVQSGDGSGVSFTSDSGAVSISAVSGDIADRLGVEANDTSIKVSAAALLTEKTTLADQLKEQEITLTLDGVTKKIKLDDLDNYAGDDGVLSGEEVINALQAKADEAFGTGKIKINAASGGASTGSGDTFQISMEVAQGSALSVSGGGKLGLADGTTSYVNTGKTLKSILGDDMGGLTADADGKYSLTINDTTLKFSADDTLDSVLTAINKSGAGVSVNYSKLTNTFSFTAKETGAGSTIDVEDNGLASALFGGGTAVDGQDAIFSVSVDGGADMTLTRSSNTVDLDGLSVTLKGTFEATEGDPVKLDVDTDTDKIVDAVKSMVEDFNAMMTEIKKAYSTVPLQNSSGNAYEPLTDDDKADMSESAIEKYEEKAKTGLLFGDRDLSALYNGLLGAVSDTNLSKIGLTISYEDGVSTLTLNEDKLRSALEEDPDAVRDAFAGTTNADGTKKTGFMQNLDTQLERYAKTTGAVKGILIEKAGSSHSPASLLENEMLTKMNNIDEQIEKWQTKMSDKVDYYTRQFTMLEQLINEMNSQSSALAGLMGGY